MVIAVRAMRRWELTFGQALLTRPERAAKSHALAHENDRPLPIEMTRAAIVIANHSSSFDPMFVAMTSGRLVHWMVAQEYCVDWRLGWFFRLSRSNSDWARRYRLGGRSRTPFAWQAKASLVGMLPERRINVSNDCCCPGRPGAVLVALKARVPIVPCYIQGAPYGGIVWSVHSGPHMFECRSATDRFDRVFRPRQRPGADGRAD